jgi:hypothetical protein
MRTTVLMFVADGNVVEENSFQLETKPAVEIDIAHVDVARVDVNLVQVPDHESIIKKAECRQFPDAFALRPGLAHQLFHLKSRCFLPAISLSLCSSIAATNRTISASQLKSRLLAYFMAMPPSISSRSSPFAGCRGVVTKGGLVRTSTVRLGIPARSILKTIRKKAGYAINNFRNQDRSVQCDGGAKIANT